MLNLVHISEAWRYFIYSYRRKRNGWTRFSGTAEEIISQIAESCWNGRYFQNSIGHYQEFWARDFGVCADALMKMGYTQECQKTLAYALMRYSSCNAITTTISPLGVPFNFPDAYSIDSLALFLRALRITKSKLLVIKYKDFLEQYANTLIKNVVDDTGLVRKNVRISSMRDYAIRQSSCYDNAMLGFLSRELSALKLKNPIKNYDYSKILLNTFWQKDHFIDDLSDSGRQRITADANIFPFWTGIVDDKKKLKLAISAIQAEGLDKPIACKYSSEANEKMNWLEIFVPRWERSACWTSIGLAFLQLVSLADLKKAQEYRKIYSSIIERDGTLFECYSPGMTPYKSAFYFADEGMLWGVNFL